MENKIVFVIGAGASKEAGLPTGLELKAKISNFLDIRFDYRDQKSGDYVITQALRRIVKADNPPRIDINGFLHHAWHIRDALPLAISIDNFIDSQRGNNEIQVLGKLSIVRSILDAERSSKLYFEKDGRNPTFNLSGLGKTWYLPFFQLITENCELADLEKRLQSIVLVIFNYDRCVEHFLINALKIYYKISDVEASRIIGSIHIYHPYGSVGNLHCSDGQHSIEFGLEPNAEQLISLSQRIKTFTEGTDPDSSEIVEIRNHFLNASKVIFMGFAFHKLNMRLITPSDIQPRPAGFQCFGSAFGISASDRETIRLQINELYAVDVDTNLAEVSCFGLFTEYWRSLAF
jgi:hypothetical protein